MIESMTPDEIARFIAKSCWIEADDENVAKVGETLSRGGMVTHGVITRTPNGTRVENFTFPDALVGSSEAEVFAWIKRERLRRKQVEQDEFMLQVRSRSS